MAKENAREAQPLCHATFSLRALPDHRIFRWLFQRLRENGKFSTATVDRGCERTERVLDAEPIILDLV